MPSRSANNHRYVPEAVQNYNLNPAASVVDKQSRYNPQVGDAAKLKQTAQGLADLAKGVTAVNIQLARMAADHTPEAYAKTEDENKAKFAEVSRKVEGFAKFNPYNREVYNTLRADTLVGNAQLKYKQLAVNCENLTPEAFDAQVYGIQTELLNNLKAEGIKAKNSANALSGFQNTQAQLKEVYVSKRAARDQAITHNTMIASTAKTFATNAFNKDISYLDGWNDAVTRLTETANGLGLNNSKQYELFVKSVNQYLTDNIDDIDAEEFMIALGQTEISGQPLSDFDPNYATTMKQMLIKAKGAKFESDAMDLKIEKLRIEKASLAANREMFTFMTEGDRSDAEILNKANEIIEANGLETIGMEYLRKIASDKQTLFNLRTVQTQPETLSELMRKSIVGELTQDDILTALDTKKLSAKDATSLFNALEADAKENYSADLAAIKDLYLDTNPIVELTDQQKSDLTKMVYSARTDNNLTKIQKAEALARAKKVAESWGKDLESLRDTSNPMNLLRAEYVNQYRVKDQDKREAQIYLAKLGVLKNSLGLDDKNIKVTSAMQEEREVTLSDGRVVKRRHNGTDVSTYLGRQVFAPANGIVVASGYEKSMGNYVLFKYDKGGYIKLMHLQAANLPKSGTTLKEGQILAHVGNTGDVTTKNKGVLHIECFNARMRLVDPKTFIKGN